jgi:hypothetical protein
LRGVVLHGAIAGDGAGFALASAGDVDGDGFDDIVIGAPTADPGGKTDAGVSFVLFGRDFSKTVTKAGTAASETLAGTATVDRILGGLGNDTLMGLGGADVLIGGGGFDTLALDGAGLTLDLTTIGDTRIRGIERIDLTGSGDNTLRLTPPELLNLSGTTNTLRVDGNAGDGVISSAAWVKGAVAGGYAIYTHGQATLLPSSALTARTVTAMTPDLQAATDSGRSNSDNITSVTTPIFRGSAEAFATVTLYDGVAAIGSAKANGAGIRLVITAALTAGTHQITARAVASGSWPAVWRGAGSTQRCWHRGSRRGRSGWSELWCQPRAIISPPSDVICALVLSGTKATVSWLSIRAGPWIVSFGMRLVAAWTGISTWPPASFRKTRRRLGR